MNKLIRRACNMISSHYGEESQQKMMIEECSELTQAICKLSRVDPEDNGSVRKNYIEELADVAIIAEQLYLLLSVDERLMLRNTLRFKIRRQLDRIEREKTEKINALSDELEQFMFERGEYDYGETDRIRWLDSIPNAYELADSHELLERIRKTVEKRIEYNLCNEEGRKELIQYLKEEVSLMDEDDELRKNAESLLSRLDEVNYERSEDE